MLDFLFLLFALTWIGIKILANKPIPLDELFWLGLFWLSARFFTFVLKQQRNKRGWETSVSVEEQDLIAQLHKEAFVHGDFESLQELAKQYGGSKDYWEQDPPTAELVAQGVKRLAEVVETDESVREPELEDFYHAGLMYEEGFGCEPDLNKALEYFEKALDTETCWSHREEDNELLRAQVNKKLREINAFLLQRQMHTDKN